MIVGGSKKFAWTNPRTNSNAADNYLGGRVMVFDLDTFQFKRGWGAYGHALSEMTTDEADRAYTPGRRSRCSSQMSEILRLGAAWSIRRSASSVVIPTMRAHKRPNRA